jgi:hypothetical protein
LGNPSAARLASGKFVMVGNGYALTSAGTGPYFRIYGADGVPLGKLVQVRPALRDGGSPPRAAAAGDGFVVVYRYEGPAKTEVRASLFDEAGAKVGTEFTVSQTNWAQIQQPDVANLDDGGFVVVWSGGPNTQYSGEIYARRYNAQGTAIGGEFTVNTTRMEKQHRPRVAGLADGGFVVVWNSLGANYLDRVYVQRYASSGQKIGGELRLAQRTGKWASHPNVAGLNNGGFVVAWTEDDASVQSVRGRRFTTAGVPSGPEFLVTNLAWGSDQMTLAVLDDDRFLVAYSKKDKGIYARLFGPTAVAAGDHADFAVARNLPGSLPNYSPAAVALPNRTVSVFWNIGDISHPPQARMRQLDFPPP